MILILFSIILSILIVINGLCIVYNTTKLNLDDAYDLAETGDIIYFRWKDVEFQHELISPFTHIGVVVSNQRSGEKYIIETHLAGDTSNMGVFTGGIHVYPFKLRLEKYEGHTFLSQLNDNDRPLMNVPEFLGKVKQYKTTIPFHDDYNGYFKRNCLKNRICKNCFDIEEKKGMFCSEFTAFCLKELGIVEQDFNHKCMVPGDFRYIENSDGRNIYKNLIKII